MTKRILAILLATMLLLSFASCKPEDDTSRPDESQNESNASEEASKDEAKTVETKYFGTLTEITDSDGRKGCLFKAEE